MCALMMLSVRPEAVFVVCRSMRQVICDWKRYAVVDAVVDAVLETPTRKGS